VTNQQHDHQSQGYCPPKPGYFHDVHFPWSGRGVGVYKQSGARQDVFCYLLPIHLNIRDDSDRDMQTIQCKREETANFFRQEIYSFFPNFQKFAVSPDSESSFLNL